MQFIQTSGSFSLSTIKPLETLTRYRKYCLEMTQKAFASGTQKRKDSPVDESIRLEPWEEIEGFSYGRCPKTGSLFLTELPSSEVWSDLLKKVATYRKSPDAFREDVQKSRLEHVHEPKQNWIEDSVLLQGMKNPIVLEVVTPPSLLTPLLMRSRTFGRVLVVDEMELVQNRRLEKETADVAVFLESLDRVDDPKKLIQRVSEGLRKKGLLFVTALVSSGFDMTILGPQNSYLYPPDRANCFSLEGVKQLLEKSGFNLLEVSTPGVLDVEVVKTHLKLGIKVPLSKFEEQIFSADERTLSDFQSYLQKSNMSSFARLVAQKA